MLRRCTLALVSHDLLERKSLAARVLCTVIGCHGVLTWHRNLSVSTDFAGHDDDRDVASSRLQPRAAVGCSAPRVVSGIPRAQYVSLAQGSRAEASRRIAAAMITTTAKIKTSANTTDFLTEGRNSCVSMRPSISLRHRNLYLGAALLRSGSRTAAIGETGSLISSVRPAPHPRRREQSVLARYQVRCRCVLEVSTT